MFGEKTRRINDGMITRHLDWVDLQSYSSNNSYKHDLHPQSRQTCMKHYFIWLVAKKKLLALIFASLNTA
jgi:hypothetical protein